MSMLTKGKLSVISDKKESARKKTKTQKREDLVKELARALINKNTLKDVPDTHSALNIIGSYIKSQVSYQTVANQGELLPGSSSQYTEITTEGRVIEIPKRNRRGRKPKNRVVHPLRELRLKRNMTLEEVANLTGLSPSYLSRLESGSRRLNVDTIEKLASVLSCRVEDLVKISNTSSIHRIQRPGEAVYSLNKQASLETSDRHYLPQFNADPPARSNVPENHIPVYGATSSSGTVSFSDPIQNIACPENLKGIPGACAYIVNDDTMTPKYNKGDYLLTHPGKPLIPRAPALIVTKQNKVILGEFVAWRHISELDEKFQPINDDVRDNPNAYLIELRQYNPQEVFSDATKGQVLIFSDEISSASRIVGMIDAH